MFSSIMSFIVFPLLHVSRSLLQGLSVCLHSIQRGGNLGFVVPAAYTIWWSGDSIRKRIQNWA